MAESLFTTIRGRRNELGFSLHDGRKRRLRPASVGLVFLVEHQEQAMNRPATISDSFEAWNRCNLNDEQLDTVISSLQITLMTMMEIGGGGMIIGSIHQMLSSAVSMRDNREEEKRGK